MAEGVSVAFAHTHPWWRLLQVLCAICEANNRGGMLGTLVKTPFRNFSKSKGKDGYLTTHNIADYHHDAVLRGKSFIETFTNRDTRISNLLDAEHQAQS